MKDADQDQVTVGDVLAVLDDLAPPALAEEWDTAVGLEIGHPDWPVKRVLITLDVTPKAVSFARESGCQLIISHHPLLFGPLPSIRQDIPEQKLVADIIRQNLSLIAAHTNLDAADGGVADCLADVLGLSKELRIAIGPYGRVAPLSVSRPVSRLIEDVRLSLGSLGCRVNSDEDRLVSRLAVFPGSFSEEAVPLLSELAVDTLVCGEIKHHVSLMLSARGVTAIEAGHDVTERVILRPLAARLSIRLPQIAFAVYEGLDYNRVAFRANQTTAGAEPKGRA